MMETNQQNFELHTFEELIYYMHANMLNRIEDHTKSLSNLR
jgi:hypothetical protein